MKKAIMVFLAVGALKNVEAQDTADGDNPQNLIRVDNKQSQSINVVSDAPLQQATYDQKASFYPSLDNTSGPQVIQLRNDQANDVKLEEMSQQKINEKPNVAQSNVESASVFPPLNVKLPYKNPLMAVLNSHSSVCVQREYRIEAKNVELSFDYNIMNRSPVKESAFYLTLNGRPISKLTSADDGKNIKLDLQAASGNYNLGFCPAGSPNEQKHQLYIMNFSFNQKKCIQKWSNDLIVNGKFDQNQCKKNWCLWDQRTGFDKVKGWDPSPQIEVGRGTVYNPAMGNSWVSEVDSKANSCFRQRIYFESGKHVLRFNWAGRSGINAKSNEFDLRVDGKILKTYRSTNDQVYLEEFEFDLGDYPYERWLEFCGTGSRNSYGAVIDNVKLFRQIKCAAN